MADRPIFYTVPEVAGLFKCSKRTVWSLVHSGQLKSVKLGALRRISADEVDRYAASLEETDRAAAM